MTLTARPYQIEDEAAIYSAWADNNRNVLYQCPTGGGKTFVGAKIVSDHQAASAIIAHRGELVLQQSMELAKMGTRHRIIANTAVTRFITREHTRQFNRHFLDPNGRVAVVAVDTLRARAESLRPWAGQIGMWVMDEAHHVLRDNKWGDAVSMFPNAWGLGVTATPNRADGKGIGAHAQGVFNHMVSGPSVSALMGLGYLSNYKIFAPPSDFDLSSLKMGGTGDYTRDSMVKETRRSHIVGDAVKHYHQFAAGKRAIVFAVDIDSANAITASFLKAGIRAASVNGKSKDTYRQEMVRKFRDGDLDVLVNVDLFGEGFDVPACECVIMARPTFSLPLYLQMFGRALRVFAGKLWGIIIDMVGNVKRHLLPDSPREWSLDDRNKQARSKRDPDAMPITTCIACFRQYEAVTSICPYCGHKAEPAGRSLPEQVDGDLTEMDAAALDKLRGRLPRANVGDTMERVLVRNGTAGPVARVIADNMRKKHSAHLVLKSTIDLWAGYQRSQGRGESENYRRFFHTFGMDVITAQTMGRPDAEALTARIRERIGLV